ncbi:MAG: stage V sporulation protein AA [Clostridia bacterium]|nr:stage V sporulation protein AA [Clostridia bacterium]NCC42857.1 stage V sporulation protein AA [Clostridia bacterium]
MSDVLYVQTDRNQKITSEQVYLQDVAQLSSNNPTVLGRCKVLKVMSLPKKKYGRYTVSAMDLIELIQRNFQKVDVVHVGEPDFILTFENPTKKNVVLSWIKTLLVCLITFFGTMFSIMTFNTDVNVPQLFQNIYIRFTGNASDGFTVLEVTYSIGIGLGVIFFFNHFGRWKMTQDPTPMEVEMRLYEDDIDTTILEMRERSSGNE